MWCLIAKFWISVLACLMMYPIVHHSLIKYPMRSWMTKMSSSLLKNLSLSINIISKRLRSLSQWEPKTSKVWSTQSHTNWFKVHARLNRIQLASLFQARGKNNRVFQLYSIPSLARFSWIGNGFYVLERTIIINSSRYCGEEANRAIIRRL